MPRQLPAALPVEASWAREEKPLPQLPSPTLTNPDYILPSAFVKIASPPRVTRRPPSPSYLRDKNDDAPRAGSTGKKEKLGLMSRKMMLLRSRTASGPAPASSPAHGGATGDSDNIPSSPILQDVGNLAPEAPPFLQLPDFDRRSASGGSSSSDISGMAAFLAKYETKDASSDDEALLYENAETALPSAEDDDATEVDSEMSEERKKQQEEEYHSAILSKRAEQILANAKKRLNVMEGNLRGAKELVAPLTAANLKRANSLGSVQYFSAPGRRYGTSDYEYEEGQQSERVIHPQSSSPTMGRDYYSHARGFSETGLPERSQTALDYTYDTYHASSRNLRPGQYLTTSNQGLRPTRSYDVLGGYALGRERPLHARDSPDSGISSYLEPLQEADETRRPTRKGTADYANHGLGIYRPSSRTSDLREQMSSLKGKISSLKERAREESLRRQSESSLRHTSPLNNAMSNAPEMYYTSSSSYGSPVLDTNAGAGGTPTSNSPASAHFPNTAYEIRAPVSGSRNAFAEQAAVQKQQRIQHVNGAKVVAAKPLDSKVKRGQNVRPPPTTSHKRTPSGTAIIESARNRYSHHQKTPSQDMPGAYIDEDKDDIGFDVPSPDPPRDMSLNSSGSSRTSSRISSHIDDDGAPSEDGASVYEDAKNDPNSDIAHEDRADAFDYQNFFLHSAMGTYSNGRRGSDSSDVSASSVETAKGPTFNRDEDHYDDESDGDDEQYPPATPETPAKLREIEASLHKRSFSEESVSTMATYATADEELDERLSPRPPPVLPPPSRSFTGSLPRPVSRPGSRPQSRPGSRPQSRPSTAVNRALPSDSSSDRADSGVGLPRRSITLGPPPGATIPKPRKNRHASNSTNVITPPTSPVHLDPAAVAVNALLDQTGRPLGLRNKAVLFSVVESLRKVVSQLQELEETSYESRDLRGRLDEAKYMLDGRGDQ